MVERAIASNLVPCQDAQNRRQAAFSLGYQGVDFFDHHASLALLNCPISTLVFWRRLAIRNGDVHFVDSLTGWARITESKHSMMQGLWNSDTAGGDQLGSHHGRCAVSESGVMREESGPECEKIQ